MSFSSSVSKVVSSSGSAQSSDCFTKHGGVTESVRVGVGRARSAALAAPRTIVNDEFNIVRIVAAETACLVEWRQARARYDS